MLRYWILGSIGIIQKAINVNRQLQFIYNKLRKIALKTLELVNKVVHKINLVFLHYPTN